MNTNKEISSDSIRVQSRPFADRIVQAARLGWLLILMLGLAGCLNAWQGGPATAPTAEQKHRVVKKAAHEGAEQDAQGVVETVIQIDLYRLSVPFGTVSANEEFWKTIDEQCVDVATYDLLFKNGLRVGRATTEQWEREIAPLIAQQPTTTHKTALVAAEVNALELRMKQGDDIEHIFYYDPTNALIGRSYERWENFMELAFQSTPRKPMHVRVSLVPGVRSLRKRLEFNLRNEEQPAIQYVSPERLYDLNLRADLPPGTFLIVAPSSEGKWPTSIGSAFLTKDEPAARMEQVLLIVPKPFVVETPADTN